MFYLHRTQDPLICACTRVVTASHRSPPFHYRQSLFYILDLPPAGTLFSFHHFPQGCHADRAGSSFASLRVEYPPTFTIARTPGFGRQIEEGMTVSLECRADVKPRMDGHWIKDEEDR